MRTYRRSHVNDYMQRFLLVVGGLLAVILLLGHLQNLVNAKSSNTLVSTSGYINGQCTVNRDDYGSDILTVGINNPPKDYDC